METYYVYIMTNAGNNVLYIGVTNDIKRRVAEHKTHIFQGFTDKYNCEKCVYVESCGDIRDAIAREKQLKRWNRSKKFALIKTTNPEFLDLAE